MTIYDYSQIAFKDCHIYAKFGLLTHTSLASIYLASTKSAEKDHTPHSVASNQVLHSLLTNTGGKPRNYHEIVLT